MSNPSYLEKSSKSMRILWTSLSLHLVDSCIKCGTSVVCAICLSSCSLFSSKVNTIDSAHFTEDGKCKDKVSHFASKAPANVKFYVEVSGSMNGFFRSNQATRFKHDLWSVMTDFMPSDGVVNVFAELHKDAVQLPVAVFREGMNQGSFVSGSSTDVPDMVARMLEDVNVNNSEVGVLVSDMKYDPTGNVAIKALMDQYSTDIRNAMMRHPKVAVCLIVAASEYLDKAGKEVTSSSPYYYLIVGNVANVVYMRNNIASLLRTYHSFVDEIEWGIDYLAPSVCVSDADYLTEIESNKSYGDFCDEGTMTLDIDITDYPWMFEQKDTLVKYLSIQSENGTKAVVDAGKIAYTVSYDDGKQLKRTAIAKVPVKISGMYEGSDVFEITLRCPEIQVPNAAFYRFIESDDINDVNTTFSMKGLLQGFYSSMERFRTPHPVHLLISTK